MTNLIEFLGGATLTMILLMVVAFCGWAIFRLARNAWFHLHPAKREKKPKRQHPYIITVDELETEHGDQVVRKTRHGTG